MNAPLIDSRPGANELPILLRGQPQRALLVALINIFERTGRFEEVLKACTLAQQQLAHDPRYRAVVNAQGWIVGPPVTPKPKT